MTVIYGTRGADGRRLAWPLLEAAVRRSAELGIDTLSLTSAPRRTAARTLYRSEGFREAETTLFRLWTENSNVKI